MRVSFVLRVDPDRLSAGQLLGEIEEVATGRIGGLQGIEDILSFCAATAGTTHCGDQGGQW